MKTEAESLRFLFVCDTDSQLYACRSLAEDLTDLGHACAFAILGEGKDLPPALRQRQLKEFPQTRETTWESLLADLRFLGADAVGVYLTGSRIHAFLQHARKSRPPEESPVYFCGFNGLVYEKFEEGMAWRLGYDVVCLNGPRDKAAFDLAFGHTKYAKQRTAIIGLNRSRSAAKRVPLIPFEQRPKLAVFAEQVAVPKTRSARIFLFQQLARIAAENADWQILIKARVRQNEATFHQPILHPEQALEILDVTSPNLAITYEPLADVISRARVMLTVSSTAVFDALTFGCQPVVLTDFGFNGAIGSHIFLGSGLESTLSMLQALDQIPIAEPASCWARSIGLSAEFSSEALVAAVRAVQIERGAAGDNPVQMDLAAAIGPHSGTDKVSENLGHPLLASAITDSAAKAHNLWMAGQCEEALLILENARENSPTNSRCRRMLAEIYLEQKMHSEAVRVLGEAVAAKPTNKALRRRLRAVLAPAPLRWLELAFSRPYRPVLSLSARSGNNQPTINVSQPQ